MYSNLTTFYMQLTLNTYTNFTSLLQSADGTRLAAVGGDNQHLLSVYLWEKRTRILSGMCGQRKVLDCCFGEGDNGMCSPPPLPIILR
jgi:hypothetical protein